jgi:deoxyribodipyrimidine photolyase
MGPHRLRATLQALHGLNQSLNNSLLFSSSLFPEEAIPLLVSSIAPHCHHLSLHFHSLSITSQPIYATTEQLVVESFIKAANEAGIQDLKAVPYYSHGLNTLYCIHDIITTTTCTTRDHNDDHKGFQDEDANNININGALMYKRWGAALDQLPTTMTEWRRLVQSSISVKSSLEQISSSSLSESLLLPSYLSHSIPAQLKDQIPSAEDSMKPLYTAAGAIDAFECLENLCCCHNGQDYESGKKILTLDIAGDNNNNSSSRNNYSDLSAVPFEINEANAKKRLEYYLNNNSSMASYQDGRMLAYGVDTSLKISPFLSLGCITPRIIWYEVVKYILSGSGSGEDDGGKYEWKEPEKKAITPAEHAIWILVHLAIRDYFIYDAIRLRINDNDNDVDNGGGTVLEHSSQQWDNEASDAPPLLFQRWARGRTGFPFIDASMKELLYTGFTSNRCRQNTASFLSKSMAAAAAVDWRQGAQLFECLLIDEDYSVNYGNWRYLAGEGRDTRGRVFKVVSQGERYDGEAVLIRRWLVENAKEGAGEKVTTMLINRPWEKDRGGYTHFGVDYPKQPIVEVGSQVGRGKKKS